MLAHCFEDGTEYPITYVSQSFAAAERRYYNLDKEALAIIFGLSKFYQYLYGRTFIIYTDHKPLSYLFDASRAIPQITFARIQVWDKFVSIQLYNTV